MRAAVMRNKKLVVDDVATPAPGPGEALVKTLACGICGSDLHALKHAEKLVEGARRSGGPFIMDLARDIVMGHEFCAEVVDHELQSRLHPRHPVLEILGPGGRDRGEHLDGLRLRHEHAEVAAEARHR